MQKKDERRPGRSAAVLLPILIGTLLLGGCYRSNWHFFVNRDGSGTAKYEMSLERSVIATIQGREAAESAHSGDIFGPVTAQAVNQDLPAEGLHCTGIEFLHPGSNSVGFVATFEFEDIGQVKIHPETILGDMARNIDYDFYPLAFGFSREGSSELIAEFALSEEKLKESEPSSGMEFDEEQMLRALLSGTSIEVVVETESPILSTDADYSTGNTVTLMNLDFTEGKNDAILEILPKVQSFDTLWNRNLRDKALEQGMTVESKDTVRVEF